MSAGSPATCGALLDACICGEAWGHEPPHRCCGPSQLLPGGCLGEWNTARDIVTYPTGAKTEAEAYEHLRQIRATGRLT